jgi:hypothetical protein
MPRFLVLAPSESAKVMMSTPHDESAQENEMACCTYKIVSGTNVNYRLGSAAQE